MKITERGIALIKSYEKCKLKAYLCPAGVWTIGWGHTGTEVHEGLVWTQAQADLTFQADLQFFDTIVAAECPDATPLQHDAMVALCYNIGPGWKGNKGPRDRDGFRQSSVRRLHLAGKYAEAAQAFALWNKAGGKVSNGLVRRRAEEAALYAEGAPVADARGYVEMEDAPTAEGERPLKASRAITGQVGAAGATIGTVAAAQIPSMDSLREIAAENPDLVDKALIWISQHWWILALAALLFIGYSMWARIDDRNNGRA